MQPRTSLRDSLSEPAPFRRAIDRLSRSIRDDGDGELAVLRRDRDRVAARLAREFELGTWTQVPVRRKRVVLDKPRDIVDLSLLDRIVHAAVAEQLSLRLDPLLPATLYSYRPGRGQTHAIHAIAEALRAYKARPIPVRERGLFAIRFDITSYGDRIRVDPESELWPALAAAIPHEDPWMLGMLHAMVRCDDPDRRTGVPVGSALANPLTNAYLADLDRELAARALMSARFGDDSVVLCETADAAAAARACIHATIARKELVLSPHKFLQIYWNGAGRGGPDGWPGATHLAYVGVEIEFGGVTRLKAAKRRQLLAAIDRRIANLSRVLTPRRPRSKDEVHARAAQLCTALRPAFELGSPFALSELPLIYAAASCRAQLAEIDRQIAVAVAGAAARKPGAAAFRSVPWRVLYELGLPSLVKLRNDPSVRR